MVSHAIPFTIPAKRIAPKTGARTELEVLIDPGCTRCLINLQTVLKLGIRAKRLSLAMKFEQLMGHSLGDHLQHT